MAIASLLSDRTVRRARARILGGLLVLVAVVSASGCSQSRATESTEVSLGGATPLQVHLGLIADPVEYAVSVREEFTIRAEVVAECMRRQGFEYVAWVPPMFAIVDTEASLTAEEYVAKYGYGISTRPDLVARTAEYPVDPNIAIAERLSLEEGAAYQRALHGVDVSGGESFEIIEIGGCMKEAEEAVTPMNAAPAEALNEYFAAKNALDERVASDPRVVDAVADWQPCMADRGYTFSDPPAAVNSVYEYWAELLPSPDPAIATPQMASVLDREALSGHVDPAVLDRLVAYELRVSGDDFVCQAAYREAETEARVGLERGFVEKHRDLLDLIQPSLR